MRRLAVVVCVVCVAVFAPLAEGGVKKRPNLVVRAVSGLPSSLDPGSSARVFDTTKNTGKKAAAASTTGFYLSTDAKRDSADLRLGARKLRPLKPGKSSTGSTRLTVPNAVAAGTYTLLVCADDGRKVKESSEKDNCRPATGTATVGHPQQTPVNPNPTPPSGLARGRFP